MWPSVRKIIFFSHFQVLRKLIVILTKNLALNKTQLKTQVIQAERIEELRHQKPRIELIVNPEDGCPCPVQALTIVVSVIWRTIPTLSKVIKTM